MILNRTPIDLGHSHLDYLVVGAAQRYEDRKRFAYIKGTSYVRASAYLRVVLLINGDVGVKAEVVKDIHMYIVRLHCSNSDWESGRRKEIAWKNNLFCHRTYNNESYWFIWVSKQWPAAAKFRNGRVANWAREGASLCQWVPASHIPYLSTSDVKIHLLTTLSKQYGIASIIDGFEVGPWSLVGSLQDSAGQRCVFWVESSRYARRAAGLVLRAPTSPSVWFHLQSRFDKNPHLRFFIIPRKCLPVMLAIYSTN